MSKTYQNGKLYEGHISKTNSTEYPYTHRKDGKSMKQFNELEQSQNATIATIDRAIAKTSDKTFKEDLKSYRTKLLEAQNFFNRIIKKLETKT